MLGNSSAELELEVVQRNLAILHVGGGRGWFGRWCRGRRRRQRCVVGVVMGPRASVMLVVGGLLAPS